MADSNALSRAVELLNRNQFSAAEATCLEVLRDAPDNAKAWHLCGVTHAQRGNLIKSAECFENATKYGSDNALYHYNLGLTYQKLRQLDRAVESYRAAIAKKSDFLEAHNNLANTLIELGANSEAIRCFRKLIELFPQSSDGHYNLANLLQDTGHVDESIAHYRLALELDPRCSAAWENLGRFLADQSRLKDAGQVWMNWLEVEPDNAIARHMLASISGENVPARCDDAYIRHTFDETFAKSFDSQLTQLQYKGPTLVSEALSSVGREMANLDVLDAGCGTGLCGSMVRSVARKLVGVDLSEDMLAEARRRGIYDETMACEITEYMRSHPRSFDLIVSADTLIYFGELGLVLEAACASLRDNGILIFTVESAPLGEVEQYRLQQHGRYCHAESYVTQSLRDTGFAVLAVTCAVLRKERGRPVESLVVTAIRNA